MSIFDKARRAVNRAVDSAVTKSVTGAVENTVSDFFAKVGVNPRSVYCPNCGKQLDENTRFCTGCGTKIEPNVQAQQSSSYQAPVRNSQTCEPAQMQSYFAQILTEMPEFTVERSASAAYLGIAANIPAKPYDFALMKNGSLAGVIMLTDHNRDKNAAFLNAKRAALGAGVPFINFYTHMANERGYVISRIRDMAR